MPAQIGRYLVLGELGRGGMGVVYRALDPVLRRPVALKVLAGAQADADAMARFAREAHATASLAHPGIVPIFEAGSHAGNPFIAMELVDGESLAAVAKRESNDPSRA